MTTKAISIPAAPTEKTFILPFSGITAVMRRPTVKEQREAMRQTDTVNAEETAMVVMSKCTTFDGESKNWMDFDKFDLADYGELADVYREFITYKRPEGNGTAPQQ